MSGILCGMAIAAFSPATRNKGETYRRMGRVQIESADEHGVVASVRGSDTYRVQVSLDDSLEPPEVLISCTCPFYDDRGPCKHLWAVLREVDDKGLLAVPRTAVVVPDVDLAPADLDAPAFLRNLARLVGSAGAKAARSWRDELADIAQQSAYAPDAPVPSPASVLPAGSFEVRYLLHLPGAGGFQSVTADAQARVRRKDGEWGAWRNVASVASVRDSLADEDYALHNMLLGRQLDLGGGRSLQSYGYPQTVEAGRVLPRLCATGRLYVACASGEYGPVAWDDGPPWRFEMTLAPRASGSGLTLEGVLKRGDVSRPLSQPVLLVSGGWVFWADAISRFEVGGSFAWVSRLRERRAIEVPVAEGQDFVARIMGQSAMPRIELPPDLRFEEVRVRPVPHFAIRAPDPYDHRNLPAVLAFSYLGHVVPAEPGSSVLCAAKERKVFVRDQTAEGQAMALLGELDVRRAAHRIEGQPPWRLPVKRLPGIVSRLVTEGWHVTARGKLYRQPGSFQIAVESGLDWFDLKVKCDYGGQEASMPALLAALRSKQGWVQLGDGSFGLLPEEWLRRYGAVAAMGEVAGDGEAVRFRSLQAGLLDAWLAALPEARVDEAFGRIREELSRFTAVEALDPPPGFVGQLRPYQREGLGWLGFLQRFGFGGCLADDMGLGKTVQVLAMLEGRRAGQAGESGRPSLVVAPRSLIDNWQREAGRFAPALRVLDYTGMDRELTQDWATRFDLVLTTYGTLRRDIGRLKDLAFDYVILDESQAAKNARAQTAKAVRLLQGRHRLALSGTPIENHLGELWSLMEFLNPGLLGGAAAFSGAWSRDPYAERRAMLSRALRPFILRRTKRQVAPDLPERQEETLYCELPERQRKHYDRIKEHYREALLARVSTSGLNRSKIQVLEALLRLRQMACHTALLDPADADETCAKFEVLLPRIAELVEEGHKALIFSQFTSYLAILRERLDASGIAYEYLDGSTPDRQARVDRFQTSPDVPLFLISLKAGGLGLNLTAADYVFLLDPWWNPATEAQAIDRAHRIGQVNKVMAYRLIARGTVEEKVLVLQEGKRELASAIIGEDSSLVRDLTREDLEFLLG